MEGLPRWAYLAARRCHAGRRACRVAAARLRRSERADNGLCGGGDLLVRCGGMGRVGSVVAGEEGKFDDEQRSSTIPGSGERCGITEITSEPI